jgi:hypothetical protein
MIKYLEAGTVLEMYEKAYGNNSLNSRGREYLQRILASQNMGISEITCIEWRPIDHPEVRLRLWTGRESGKSLERYIDLL